MNHFLRQHQKTIGIALIVLFIFFGTCLYQAVSNGWDWSKVRFWRLDQIDSMAHYTGMFAIIAIGAAIVISTGGVDLSMGALMGLTGVLLPMLIRPGQGEPFIDWTVDPWLAWLMIGGIGMLIGWIHGMLITKLRLQPFLVTLCGLFIYRGIAQTITQDVTKGLGEDFTGLKALANGHVLGLPTPFVIALVMAAVVSVLMHRTVFGRHLLALGRNEQAAAFSGIRTDRVKITAYMLCSLIAAMGGAMFTLEGNSAAPTMHCQGFELYAIAGAVLGGCSLRGGECSMAGVILGTALMQVAQDSVMFLNVSTRLKLTVVGTMILIGVIADEIFRRSSARRSAQQKEA